MEVFDVKKLLAIPLAALLCACAPASLETPEIPSGLVRKTFTAVQEGLTKTALSPSYGILWSTSDKVSLFASTGSAGTEFTVGSTSDSGSCAVFSGLTPESSNGYYYALSPASASARLASTGGTILAELPRWIVTIRLPLSL